MKIIKALHQVLNLMKDFTAEYSTKNMDKGFMIVDYEGKRMFEQWIEELAKKKLPPKEVTIADIEKQLGYKIKIVGEKY